MLLDTIEGRLHGEQTSVYSNVSTDTEELNRIIRYSLLTFFFLSACFGYSNQMLYLSL